MFITLSDFLFFAHFLEFLFWGERYDADLVCAKEGGEGV